jgi:hypothetical protein
MWEYNGTVHQLFIDFKKAYDSVLFIINPRIGLQQLAILLFFQPFFSFPHTLCSIHPS